MHTSIQIEKEIKEHLDKLKNHPRETYNDVLTRIINFMSQQNMDKLSQQTIKNIEKSLSDIKAGRISSHKDVKRRLGLK
jgi:uncharacterized protein (UPF0248 family)